MRFDYGVVVIGLVIDLGCLVGIDVDADIVVVFIFYHQWFPYLYGSQFCLKWTDIACVDDCDCTAQVFAKSVFSEKFKTFDLTK